MNTLSDGTAKPPLSICWGKKKMDGRKREIQFQKRETDHDRSEPFLENWAFATSTWWLLGHYGYSILDQHTWAPQHLLNSFLCSPTTRFHLKLTVQHAHIFFCKFKWKKKCISSHACYAEYYSNLLLYFRFLKFLWW